MTLIHLTPIDLALAAILVLVAAGVSRVLHLGLARPILVAAARTAIQLTLIGLVLKALFGTPHPGWIALMALIMVAVAGREVMARQDHRLKGWQGFGLGTLSLFVSSFAVSVLALVVIISADPWYTPQYAIPLLGMLLGNTMNGIALGLNQLTRSTWEQQAIIEGRLALGHSWDEAISAIRTDSIRNGLIPIVNAMAAAGLVSLPGMMTGQILAGAPPVEAVKYQIMIMFLIAGGTALGTVGAVWMGSRHLFDHRQRLRLDRLSSRRQP